MTTESPPASQRPGKKRGGTLYVLTRDAAAPDCLISACAAIHSTAFAACLETEEESLHSHGGTPYNAPELIERIRHYARQVDP